MATPLRFYSCVVLSNTCLLFSYRKDCGKIKLLFWRRVFFKWPSKSARQNPPFFRVGCPTLPKMSSPPQPNQSNPPKTIQAPIFLDCLLHIFSIIFLFCVKFPPPWPPNRGTQVAPLVWWKVLMVPYAPNLENFNDVWPKSKSWTRRSMGGCSGGYRWWSCFQ